jgi:4-hydroxy-tetrahydrodipicolinate reductase
MAVRVGVFGAAGRMGRTVCDAVDADPDLELVARVDVGDDPDLIAAAGAEVAVDFTEASAARGNARWCAAKGIHAVIGTSGLTEADHADLRSWFTSSNALVAPNFAIGAVLMVRFAELAAPFFETVDIIEMHHDQKIDAPSGTAVHTAERIAAASTAWAEDPTTKETIPGARGAVGAGGVHLHALRVRGMVASQEVLFGTTGQSLSIRHDTTDRSSFMPGVVLACKRIADHPGVTVGLETYLGI